MNSRVITRDYLVMVDMESTQLRYTNGFDRVDTITAEALQTALEEKEKLWERRFEHVRNSSLREGYQAGLEEGKAAAQGEYREKAVQMQKMMGEIEKRVEEHFAGMEPAIADLVFKIAGKVLQVPVEDKGLKKQVADDIQQALRELTNKSQVVVSVSASDYETVEPLLRRSVTNVYIDISLHDDLNPGEYLIETPNEIIEKNFSRILDRLNKSYQASKSEKQINSATSEDEHVEISN
ncbi:MAG TPA: FliH/SctL family protein [Balneolales bacterium]|nr:FliH/SctL family protein [Balneolales bacterium]